MKVSGLDSKKSIYLSSEERLFKLDETHYGGNQEDFPEKEYREKGCGVIAIANTVHYIVGTRPGFFRSFPYKYSYSELCGEIKKVLPPDADGITLSRVFRKLTGNALAYFPFVFNPRGKMLGIIENALSEDIPVIVSVFCFRRKDEGFRIKCGENEQFPKAHYMTAYALICEDGKVLLGLSSWGKRFTIDFDEFCAKGRKNPINAVGTGVFIPKGYKE